MWLLLGKFIHLSIQLFAGDSNIVSRCSFCFRRGSRIVLQRLRTLQFRGRMPKVPNLCCLSFPKLDNHSHFGSDYALDTGCSLNTYSYHESFTWFSYICLIFVHFFDIERESRYVNSANEQFVEKELVFSPLHSNETL